MKNLYDYHLHSLISFDGSISINDICKAYQKKGVRGMTFTEHIEHRQPHGRDILPDKKEYLREIEDAKKAYPMLEIGMGIELGLQPYAKEVIIEESKGPWDFILGSVHRLNYYPADRGYINSGLMKKEYMRSYFIALYEAAEALPCFDVMGHIDLFLRDEDILDKNIRYHDFADELDMLFKSLIDNGKGIEVNTAGFRYGMEWPHPEISLLKRYRELGGEIVTVGSDSHSLKGLAFRLEEGYQYLLEAGFKYFSTFKGRELRQMPIE